MPLTEKGAEIKKAMEQQYGEKKGEQVFYASKNKGTITGVDQSSNILGGPKNFGMPSDDQSTMPPTPTSTGGSPSTMTSPPRQFDAEPAEYKPVSGPGGVAMTTSAIQKKNEEYWKHNVGGSAQKVQ
jgi:hypothetical protein